MQRLVVLAEQLDDGRVEAHGHAVATLEHGSGLVPIAEPARFQWAGWWIAVVRTDSGEVAAL